MSLTKRNTLIEKQRTSIIKVNNDHEFPKSASVIIPKDKTELR